MLETCVPVWSLYDQICGQDCSQMKTKTKTTRNGQFMIAQVLWHLYQMNQFIPMVVRGFIPVGSRQTSNFHKRGLDQSLDPPLRTNHNPRILAVTELGEDISA